MLSMRSFRRTLVVLLVFAGLEMTGVGAFHAWAWDSSPLNRPVVRQDYRCGRNDHTEPKLQGQVPKEDQASGEAKKGYNCGLELVGFTALAKTADGKGTRPNANANMYWAGDCAYVSPSNGSLFNPPVVTKAPTTGSPGGPGVAVVDLHSPAHPRMVRILREPGDIATSETIGAMTKPDGTAIVVVGQYGNDPASYPKPMDIYIYDTHDPDCSHLRHIPNPTDPSLATYYWPKNIHNLTIAPDGNHVYATLPIQAIDISGIWGHLDDRRAASRIKYLGSLNDAMNAPQEGVGPQNDLVPASANLAHPLEPDNVHEAWVEDNKTLYIAGQTPDGEIFSIVDISQWLASGGAKPATVLSETAGRGHSIRTATIGSKKYVLHSEESVFNAAYGCVPQVANPFAAPAQPWLTNVDDPRHPRTVSQMGLRINDPESCPTQVNDGTDDSVHYHDVDNAKDTHFVMASMWIAGIRVFDVRNPSQPTEVAYFNSADIAPRGQAAKLDHVWGHTHYDAKRGNVWFASASGGFYVVRIEDQVRKQLGLTRNVPPAPATHVDHGKDAGWPGTRGVTYALPATGLIDAAPYYCTLAPLTQRL